MHAVLARMLSAKWGSLLKVSSKKHRFAIWGVFGPLIFGNSHMRNLCNTPGDQAKARLMVAFSPHLRQNSSEPTGSAILAV